MSNFIIRLLPAAFRFAVILLLYYYLKVAVRNNTGYTYFEGQVVLILSAILTVLIFIMYDNLTKEKDND